MSHSGLCVEALRVRHGGAERPALDGLSVAVGAGEVLAVVGESGSGKSTLAQALVGLLPTAATVEGRIRLGADAVDAVDRPALARWRGRRIGLAFQDALASLHPMRTVGDQLDEVLARHAPDLPRAARREAAHRLAADVGLEDAGTLLARHPHRLSGGQRQRVGIALALAGRPEVLVADEVTSALDPPRAAAIAALLRRLADGGLAVIAIAHDLDRIGAIADRLVVLRRGAVVETGLARECLARPTSAYLRNLLASRPRLDANPPRLPVADPDDELIVAPTPKPSATVSPGARSPVLAVRGLSVRHVAYPALDGIGFDLSPGEVLGVVGPSGCGKSTLARALLRLDRASGGTIEIAGRDLLGAEAAALAGLRRQVGLVFQDPSASLDPRWPAWRAIAEPLVVAGVGDAAERRRRALALLEDVGLGPDFAERRPHELSGGQQQRVAIARALALSPPILVCDEAVSALDLGVQAGILNLLRDQCERRGLAVLFVSHDLAAVRFVADRVLVLEAGRIVESGPVTEVLSNPSHPASRALLAATPLPIESA
jgi:peptide/nickel transport system ATP-binding protein